MHLRFYSRELESSFRDYVEQMGITNTSFFNKVFSIVFSLKKRLNDDLVENLRETVHLINHLEEWEEVRAIHRDLRDKGFTRNVSMSDVVIGLIQRGIKAYKAENNGANSSS